ALIRLPIQISDEDRLLDVLHEGLTQSFLMETDSLRHFPLGAIERRVEVGCVQWPGWFPDKRSKAFEAPYVHHRNERRDLPIGPDRDPPIDEARSHRSSRLFSKDDSDMDRKQSAHPLHDVRP